MKRKITELEKRLIEKDYVLECKTYTKKRNRIESYVYQKVVDDYVVMVVLDPYRENILSYGFKKIELYFDYSTIEKLNNIYKEIAEEIIIIRNGYVEKQQEEWLEDDFVEEVEDVLKEEE